MAALLAAVVSLGGVLLFAEYFGSIEVRTESEGVTRVKHQPDTQTRTENSRSATQSKACSYTDTSGYCMSILSNPGHSEVYCRADGLTDYTTPRSSSRIFPGRIYDLERNFPDTYIDVSFCIDSTGRVQNPRITSMSGAPNFNRMTLRVLERWVFEPATSNGNDVGVCECQLEFMFESREGRPYEKD